MRRNFKYRLYPNREQTRRLARVLEIHRQLYNAALLERRAAWQKRGISLSYYDQANQLKALRAVDQDAAWLNYSSTQQTLRRLDKAFAAFFRRVRAGDKAGYPRFKSRRRWKSVEYRYGDGARLVDVHGTPRLYLQKVGRLKVGWHRAIPEPARITNLWLKREVDRWYVIFSLDLPDPAPAAHPGPAVGVDLGLHALLALSDGRLMDNPRWYRSSETKLAQAQRVLSRRKKYSNRWRKAARRVARLHLKIANQRRDLQHKLARELVNTYSLIVVEDLNIDGLSRSHLAKSVHDAAWSQLLTFLSYKAEEAGSQVVAVDPRHSSQVCSGCGCLVRKTLQVRVHDCPECGLSLDRDVNAARNVLKLAVPTQPAASQPARTGPTVKSPTSVGRSREAALF